MFPTLHSGGMENLSPYVSPKRVNTINVPGRWDRSLRTFSILKGLPVYEKSRGEKLGEVYDLHISNTGIVKGLLLKTGALFKKSFFIAIDDVASFGWDGVMVEDPTSLKPLKKPAAFTLEGHEKLMGRPLMTAQGEKLGILEDVYFKEELGTIVGYECSDGFFSDMVEGKRVIKTDDPPTIGKDAIIVDVDENMGE